jgi:hypothetical protein
MERCTSSPRYVVCSDSLGGTVNSESCSPDVGNLTAVPQLSSCRWRKRRHRGRHRRRNYDNAMVTESPPDDPRLQSPSARTTASGSSSLPTAIPSALSLHRAESDVVSKSAPCGDPVSWDLESESAERVSHTSAYTLDSPPFQICSSSSPDLTWSTNRSWYSQAFPFFSVSLGGDDDVTKVQCILLIKILSWRSVGIWFECLPEPGVLMEFFLVFRGPYSEFLSSTSSWATIASCPFLSNSISFSAKLSL